MRIRLTVKFLSAAVVIFFLVSCASRSSQRFQKLSGVTEKNEYQSAINLVHKNPDLYGKTNQFLYYMDVGVLYHYAEQFDSSSYYLEQAVKTYDDLFAKSITNEAASVLTNDLIRPYRSKPYELTMVYQLLALNYLATGKVDEALVETRRMQLHFDEWERQDPKGEKYTSDGMFHYLSSIAYDAAGETDNSLISLFKAAESYKKSAVPFPREVKNQAYYRLKNNDREADIDLLKINAEDPEEQVKGLENNSSEIILIGYAGKGPVIEEISWWGTWIKDGMLVVHYKGPDGKTETVALPAPGIPQREYDKADRGRKTRSGTTFHIKFAMPSLAVQRSRSSYFTVKHSSLSSSMKTTVVNDLDNLAKENLEDNRTNILMRTVVRVILRTIASEKTKSAVSGSHPLLNLLLNLGTDALSDQLERADTRNCFLIPKTVQIARIPVTPGIHKLEASAHDESGRVIKTRVYENIKIKNGEKKFIFFPSVK